MTDEPAAKDLVVLAADGQIAAALEGLLSRAKSLRFRDVTSNIFALSAWLKSEGFRTEEEAKPRQPKRALEEALQLARKRRSSSIYRQLAERVGVHRCTDPAFLKLKTVLQSWFGTAVAS